MTITDPNSDRAKSDPTVAEVLQAASGFVPELQERAVEFDALRQLPQDIAERMAAAGFYRLCAPTGAGGLGFGPRVMCEVVETLATGNGSAAWCAFIGSTSHINMAGASEDFRADEGAGDALITAGVFSPSGTAVAQARDGVDGYVVNGHWRWGSGCRNAAWISGALAETDESGAPMENSSLSRVWLHPDDVDIQDNWHVSGLRGSGSSDFVVSDVWVPSRRAIDNPYQGPFRDERVFRFAAFGLLAIPIGAIALGMAQASLDDVAEVARTKTPNSSRRTLATRPLVHYQFAQAQTRLRAARALFYATIDEQWERTETGSAGVDDRVAIRAAICHAVETATEVIDQAFSIAGGTSIYEDSPLQRHQRDVHVAAQHMMVADSVMELAGRVMLGVDTGGGVGL